MIRRRGKPLTFESGEAGKFWRSAHRYGRHQLTTGITNFMGGRFPG